MLRIAPLFAAAIATTAAFGAASPASAVVVGFASYSPIGSLNNVRYTTGGQGGTRANNGVFESVTAVRVGNRITYTPGPVAVKFSFLYPEFAAYVSDITAVYSLNAVVTKNTAPSATAGAFSYANLNGDFSFRTTSAITVSAPYFQPHTYAAGSLLLGGHIVNGNITGTFGGTSGGSASSGLETAFQFASDFLDFANVANVDFSQSLTSVTAPFSLRTTANPRIGLSTFTGLASGTFSSDPLPGLNGLALPVVPEPEIWAMLVVGFGLVGVQTRRRNRTAVTA